MLNFEAEADKIASGMVSVSTNNSREAELTFKGDKDRKLAFGVELCQLRYDALNQQFSLPPVTESFKVRGKNNVTRTRKIIKPTFIGDPIIGNMFIEIV